MRLSLHVLILFFLTGLSVSAQNVLLVDKRLQDPITFKPFFDDFPEHDLEFRYRRFHPSLIPHDIENFDVIMVAGGTHPDPAATHLIPEEAALLTRFVRDGGTAVFLSADQSTDNYVFNTILDSLGIDVRIEGKRIEDPLGPKATINPATHYLNLARVLVSPETPLGRNIEGAIAGGRLPSVLIGQTKGIEIAAYTAPFSMRRVDVKNTTQRGREAHYAGQARSYAAVVAATVGEGHVILLPRFLINLNGYTGHGNLTPIEPPYWLEQNRRFEKNLAGYIGSIARDEYAPKDLIPLSRIDNLDDPGGLPEPVKFRKRTLDEKVHDQDYDDLTPFTNVPPHHASFLEGQKVRSAHVSPPAQIKRGRRARPSRRWA